MVRLEGHYHSELTLSIAHLSRKLGMQRKMPTEQQALLWHLCQTQHFPPGQIYKYLAPVVACLLLVRKNLIEVISLLDQNVALLDRLV